MRILVIEDEQRIADFLDRGLASAGYAVDVVGTGREALAAIHTTDYDLLILDLMLPRMNGWQVIDALKTQDITKVIAAVVVAAMIVLASVAGYHIIMRMQSYLTWITGIVTILFVVIAAKHVDGGKVSALPSGPWQAVVGAWVPSADLGDRLHAYAEKAAREGGVGTTWEDPDASFEARVHGLVDGLAVRDIPAFEAQLVPHMAAKHADILDEIRTRGEISPDLEKRIKAAISSFLETAKFSASA